MDIVYIYLLMILSLFCWLFLKHYLDKYHASAEGLMNDLLGKMDWKIIILSMLRILFMLAFWILFTMNWAKLIALFLG